MGQYLALRTYAESVSGLCAQVGETTGQPETTLRLVSFVEEIRDKTWGDIKAALTRFVTLPLGARKMRRLIRMEATY